MKTYRTSARYALAAASMLALTALSFNVKASDEQAPAAAPISTWMQIAHGGPAMHGDRMPMHGERMGPGGSPEQMGEHMTKRHERMLERLQAAIKPNADQQAAWTAFADSARRDAPKPPAVNHDELRKASAPDRFEVMAKMAGEHQAALTRMSQELRKLYAVLTPEQRTAADQALTPRGDRMGMRRGPASHGGHGGMHGGDQPHAPGRAPAASGSQAG